VSAASAPAAGGTDAPFRPPRLDHLTAETIGWFQTNGVNLAIACVAGAAIVFALLGLRRLGRRLIGSEMGADWRAILGRVIEKTSTLFIIAVSAQLVTGYTDPPAALDQTATFLFTVIAAFQGAIWARELVLGFVEHRTFAGEHEGLASALGIIRLLVTTVFFAVALLVVLDNLGVNITGLVAGLGVGGIAIGLAAQGIFADLFAALSILFDRPFRRGDAVTYDTTSGSVEAIGLKSTRIRSITGEERIISNTNLLNKEISNNSRRNARRFKFAIGVIYQTDPDAAAGIPDLLKEIVEGLDHKFVRSGFVGFGASSLDFELEFDVAGTEYQVAYDARHAVGMAVLKRFNQAGLEFAYPTQTTFTAAPDGRMVMPFAEVQPVRAVGDVPA